MDIGSKLHCTVGRTSIHVINLLFQRSVVVNYDFRKAIFSLYSGLDFNLHVLYHNDF